MALTGAQKRNPRGFAVGDRVRVIDARTDPKQPPHRNLGAVGFIEKLDGVDVEHGKPRAHIRVKHWESGSEYIHVSLPNLDFEPEPKDAKPASDDTEKR
jgi:hypothetical protein